VWGRRGEIGTMKAIKSKISSIGAVISAFFTGIC